MARSINLFRWIRKMYRMIGIYPTSRSNQNFFANCKKFIIFVSMLILFIASTAFLFFEAKTISEGATAFSSSILVLTVIVLFLITLMEMRNITELIGKFKDFIEMRVENPDSMVMYTEFNRKIEWFCKWAYIVIVYVSLAIISPFLLLISYINYYILDLKDESFVLISPAMFPFDWRTPFGYLIAKLSETVSYASLLLCVTPILCFYVAACWLIITIAKDITNDLELLNVGGASERSCKMMRKRFAKIIQMHSNLKELAVEFNGVYEFITFVYFLWTLLGLCCYAFMLLLQLKSENANPGEAMNTLTGMGYSFGTLFLYCEVGERVTHQFNQFNEKFCNCNWNLFPIEIQHIYLICLVGVQQPVIIEGYAGTVCTRDAFKKTVNGGFSYLMMLRRIDE